MREHGQSILQGPVSAMPILEAELNKCFLNETTTVNICNEWFYIGYVSQIIMSFHGIHSFDSVHWEL